MNENARQTTEERGPRPFPKLATGTAGLISGTYFISAQPHTACSPLCACRLGVFGGLWPPWLQLGREVASRARGMHASPATAQSVGLAPATFSWLKAFWFIRGHAHPEWELLLSCTQKALTTEKWVITGHVSDLTTREPKNSAHCTCGHGLMRPG